MKKITVLSSIAFLALSVFMTTMACAAIGKSKWPMTIEYVTFVDKTHISVTLYKQVLDEIEKRSEGKLKFVNRGGPEAIKIFAQGMAVSKGATDMVFTTPSFMGKLVKGTSMLSLCDVPVSEHRKIGLYDYMNELFNKKNIQFLTMYPRSMGSAYLMLSQKGKDISSVADLKGKIVRGGDYQDGVAPKFGMTTVSMKHFEEYSGLEKGIINMGRMTIESMVQLRLYEVGKQLVLPAYGSNAMSWYMNLDKWNDLPAELQAVVVDTMYEMAPKVEKDFDEYLVTMYKEMADNGVKTFEFQGAERDEYINKTREGMKEYFMQEDPAVGQKIFDMVTKK